MQTHHILSPKDRAAPTVRRFWAKVDKSAPGGCWLWTAARNLGGYGKFALRKERTPTGRRVILIAAHRYAYLITHGDIPAGLWVLHRCPGGENRRCVNPVHLYLGNAAANNRDTAAGGRRYTPPDAGWLTLKQAASILGVTPERVRVLVKQGRLTAKRVGQFIHILDANLSDPDVRQRVCRGWMGHRATPVRGENSGTAKLTRGEVLEILARKGGTESMSAIGREYGVTYTTIRRIWDGQTWALYLQDTATDALAGPASLPGSGLGSGSG